MNVIEIKDLVKQYPKVIALNHISLSIRSGEIVLLVGHNGSGKSTLLKCIMNHIRYIGKIECFEPNIGYIPEKVLLPDFMKVEQFLIEIGRLKSTKEIEINPLLERYQLLDKKNHKISSLSKGMKQKLLIIQSFMGDTKLFLFDEPLNGLDEASKELFMQDIQSLSSLKCTIIITTHSPEHYPFKERKLYHFIQGEVHEVR
ncbi:MAG TPA: ABC transporter ATP-binding protein [Bacilli bacterium]|nr:ABC transporter ATP-binding protein [Bacilli bacterium]